MGSSTRNSAIQKQYGGSAHLKDITYVTDAEQRNNFKTLKTDSGYSRQ